jgi:hypothetical protein
MSRYFDGFKFTDPADPALGMMVVQSMFAGQPSRYVDQGGAAIATEAGLARLGDRFDKTAWSLARLRIGTVLLACLLSFGMGAGGVMVAFKQWGTSLADVFNLPRADDARLNTLAEFGAVLRVEKQKGTVYLYFDGDVQPSAGHGNKNYLFFKP